MARHQSHMTFSIILGISYAVFGISVLDLYPELVLLASIVVIVGGVLPNVDDSSNTPARELGGLLAAIAPLVLLEFYPSLKTGGVSRILLVVVCSYVLTRIVIIRTLQQFTIHRGLLHSIPASIITFELVYLLFWDLYWVERLYMASGAFVGYFSHLLLDAYGNLDIIGRAMGNAKRKSPVLKFATQSHGATFVVYLCMIGLGYYVAKDLYPHLANILSAV